MSPRTARRIDIGSQVVVLLLAVGWCWSVAVTARGGRDPAEPTATSAMVTSLTSTDAPNAAYLTDAALGALTNNLRGASGKLLAKIRVEGTPIAGDTVAGGAQLMADQGAGRGTSTAPEAGIWRLALAVGNALKPIGNMSLITLRPRNEKQNGRVGLYFMGNWRGEKGDAIGAPGAAPESRYQPPSGFIEVTQANADTKVSEHFKLRDFLTHDQQNVWPKYLVLELRNVDKLELVLSDLQARGIDVSHPVIMSGFRTPQYNAGGGETSGRAGLSRHMYGDAADVFIDSNHDGVMDDLNHDGKISIADSRVISAAVDRVEAAHPDLVGGAGVYPAESGHGPFIHIDTRGYHARWVGSGGG